MTKIAKKSAGLLPIPQISDVLRAVHRTVDGILVRPYGHSAYTGDGTPVTVLYD